ncbi:hypothetical protein FA13DRAFT_665836 [Coprinellus micaceus]|uniref:Uncharacterized protein n=1 Tax=Coprinellus micaceus TaxID=71717 RepID=A0A4Y7T6H2_COPMI|nr:hypothetical protein FA13DRAFT_665836 [Coprinellus micaceus]
MRTKRSPKVKPRRISAGSPTAVTRKTMRRWTLMRGLKMTRTRMRATKKEEAAPQTTRKTIPGFAGFGDPHAAFLSSSSSASEGEDEGDGSGEEEEEEEDGGEYTEQKALDDFEKRVNHLPDHLFEAAFSSAAASSSTATSKPNGKTKSTPSSLPSASTSKAKAHQPSRKRRRPNTDLDIEVTSSKRIKVLGTTASGAPRAPLSRPSRKVAKFLDRTLALKGAGKKRLGWERRPANIGLMRSTSGPAANFVRGQ